MTYVAHICDLVCGIEDNTGLTHLKDERGQDSWILEFLGSAYTQKATDIHSESVEH